MSNGETPPDSEEYDALRRIVELACDEINAELFGSDLDDVGTTSQPALFTEAWSSLLENLHRDPKKTTSVIQDEHRLRSWLRRMVLMPRVKSACKDAVADDDKVASQTASLFHEAGTSLFNGLARNPSKYTSIILDEDRLKKYVNRVWHRVKKKMRVQKSTTAADVLHASDERFLYDQSENRYARTANKSSLDGEKLMEAIGNLPPDQGFVIQGLLDGRTLTDLARVKGTTVPNIFNLRKAAIKNLRDSLR